MQGAQYAKFFDPHGLLALAANASGIEQLDGLLIIAHLYTVHITRGAGNISHQRLLLASQGVKEVAFAHIRSANQGYAQYIAGLAFALGWDISRNCIE